MRLDNDTEESYKDGQRVGLIFGLFFGFIFGGFFGYILGAL